MAKFTKKLDQRISLLTSCVLKLFFPKLFIRSHLLFLFFFLSFFFLLLQKGST